MSKSIRRINVFAGPGAGKSTLAPQIYAALKKDGYDVEHVSEFIKDWAYMGIKPKGRDQFYIFAQQMHAEEVKLRHVKLVVTDSPLLMNTAYSEFLGCKFTPRLIEEAQEFDADYPPINLFIERTVTYNPDGRYQTYEQALEFDKFLLEFLATHLKSDWIIRVKVDQFDNIMLVVKEELIASA